jgi:hypothetical protein
MQGTHHTCFRLVSLHSSSHHITLHHHHGAAQSSALHNCTPFLRRQNITAQYLLNLVVLTDVPFELAHGSHITRTTCFAMRFKQSTSSHSQPVSQSVSVYKVSGFPAFTTSSHGLVEVRTHPYSSVFTFTLRTIQLQFNVRCCASLPATFFYIFFVFLFFFCLYF